MMLLPGEQMELIHILGGVFHEERQYLQALITRFPTRGIALISICP